MLFLLPFTVFYTIFTIWPIIQGLYVSLHKWGLMGKQRFVGLKNYQKFLGDRYFWEALGNTTKFVVLTVPVLMVLALLLVGGGILSRTAFGRDFYAVGDNLAAARQLGVAVNRTRMLAFTLNGMLAACAGIVFAAQIGFVPNQTGSGLEMKAIAACVLGGISLLGGTGTLLSAFLGAFFLTQIDTVLVLFRLPAWWNDFIAGLVLLGVLVLDGRLRQALARHQRALKYSRFQPGNKGGKRVAPFPERKNKEVA